MAKSLSEMSLEELWALFPIILRNYNPEWPQWYQEEEQLLLKVFSQKLVRIQHIGSTSVPGLMAKPTIDILLEASADCSPEELRGLGGQCGYVAMAESSQGAYRLDMCKGYTPEGFAERVYHLHIRYEGDWDEPYFNEYLRRHPEKAAEYVALKVELQKLYEHNRDAYTGAKGKFVRECTIAARKELSGQ